MSERWTDYVPTSEDKNRTAIIHGAVAYTRGKVHEYLSRENLEAIDFYNRYRTFGFAYAGGWAEQPARHIDLLYILDAEHGRLEAWLRKELRSRYSQKSRNR